MAWTETTEGGYTVLTSSALTLGDNENTANQYIAVTPAISTALYPNWENRKTQIESRINAIAELYPKILRDVGWKKVRLPNKENIPYSTQVELKTLLEEKSALNKKLKDGRRFFGYVFGKQGLKEHGGGDDLIKKYEKNIKKLNQAENNLATFKTTHKLK